MALPLDWQSPNPTEASNLGHKKAGRTVAIHSLAVLPEFQGDHLGTTFLNGFVKMVRDAKVADRIALITYEKLTTWYERFGFKSRGPSNCQYGGGGWFDMVCIFECS
jgi:GNAT superfamily N-acetyltransferase